MRKWIAPIFVVAVAFATLLSCRPQSATSTSDAPGASRGIGAGEGEQFHAIVLPKYHMALPPGPGQEAFAAACLTCHSTRYIGMQPPLTAVKWEENVRKMMKTYGAPLTEQQVPLVVQYLMATKESPGGVETWNSMALVVDNSQPAPVLSFPTQGNAREAMLMRGAALYAHNCASCHGATGKGDGKEGAKLLPRPTDLTAGRLSVPALSSSLYHGVPATAMPSFRALPTDDLRALAAFTQNLCKPSGEAAHFPATQTQARDLYAANCASCHGVAGRGDGPAAPPLARPPANFHLKQPTHEYAMRVIAEGIPGSTMPRWNEKLTEPQRQLLSEYIRSLYESE